ncbi:hypothetical protein KOR42_34500 [Thalassoglobus neptunius]|uniref:Uncharacterized protein n=1 Tax=Thalassoglobus neptunius TaxID=1938619 RepID=A0A5C5WP09_9PLAN|nr:hypothetical protein KOR42_34500 [Thalassoglobus neptunius]
MFPAADGLHDNCSRSTRRDDDSTDSIQIDDRTPWVLGTHCGPDGRCTRGLCVAGRLVRPAGQTAVLLLSSLHPAKQEVLYVHCR